MYPSKNWKHISFTWNICIFTLKLGYMDFNLGYILRVNYTSCRRQVSEGNASLSAAASLYTRATTSHSVSSFSFSTQKTQESRYCQLIHFLDISKINDASVELSSCQLRQTPFPVVWSACAPIKWHPLDKSQMGVDSTWHIYLFTNTVYWIVILDCEKYIWRNKYAKEEYISILAMWDLCKYHDLSRPPCPNSALSSKR